MIGVCPDCGRSGGISWNSDTDVSTCSCGWHNDNKPQRGLRAKTNIIDEGGTCSDKFFNIVNDLKNNTQPTILHNIIEEKVKGLK
jgi:hypothetical protein